MYFYINFINKLKIDQKNTNFRLKIKNLIFQHKILVLKKRNFSGALNCSKKCIKKKMTYLLVLLLIFSVF